MERLQGERMQAIQAGGGDAGGNAGGTGENTDIDKLRQAVIDLQGVANYHRSQKELMEATKQVG